MAGLRQQQPMLAGLGLLQLTLSVFLLFPPSDALPGDTKRSSSTSVEVVRGLFSRAILSLGYHKILEIPVGAQNITIRETIKSRNYLALGTGSGVSIINGNWSINKPGVYLAAGTRLTYRRPNEVRSRTGESITAPGPITEELHLYVIYQKPGPSVYYEYSLLPHNTHTSPQPDTLPDIVSLVVPSNKESIGQNLVGNYILNEQEHTNQVPSHPFVSPDSWSSYIWTSTGHTPCTTTCGTGRRQALWRCTERKTQTTVASDLCGPALPPLNHEEDCNTQPCPAFWDFGEWSECSKRCGPGVQHRQVHCRQVTDNNSNGTVRVVTVGTDLCEDDVTAMPATSQPCQLKVCSQWQLRSDWSPCSVPCGVGQRSREVVCVGGTGLVEEDQECNLALKPDHLHNCDMGACARSWYTSLWSQRCSAECGKGKRTRASVCLVDHVTNLRLGGCEGERPQEVTSCDAGPCRQQVEWYAGPWGQCSAECGNGTQTRGVACLLRDEGRLQAVDQSKCFHLPQPISSQPCQLKLCGMQWYMTEWSACSRSCEGGYRVREVRCLADNMAPSDLCDPSLTPESSAECNPQPCVTDASSSCRDQYDNCVVVVQARLCVYPYYRTACCTSCSRVTNKHPYPYLKTHRRRHTLQHTPENSADDATSE